MEDISLKEVLIAIAVVAISMTISIFVYQPIQEGLIAESILYRQALKIENDSGRLYYSQETNVGNVLAYGSFTAMEYQSMDEVQGEYAIILRTKEKYQMHTRTVQDCDAEGNCTTRVETYYSWDAVGKESNRSPEYIFMSVLIQDSMMNLSPQHRLYPLTDFIQPELLPTTTQKYYYPNGRGDHVGNIRYYYDILPKYFYATAFLRFMDGKITNPIDENKKINVFYEVGIDEVIHSQDIRAKWIKAIYYILWFLLTSGLYFYIAYEWLEIY